jgi:hypothetical protein
MLSHFDREGIIWRCHAPPSQKLLMLALNSFVDGEGKCYPGVERLAQMMGASTATVKRAIRELESGGVINRQSRRAGGKQTSNLYTVDFGKISSSFCTPEVSAAQNEPRSAAQNEPRSAAHFDPRSIQGLTVQGLTVQDPPIVPQGGLDTTPSALALGGEANQLASPNPADSPPVEVVASSVKGRGSARRDRIAEVFELGRTALDVRRFHGQYRMLCNMVGAAPGALSKAQQAAASCWDGGEVPQGFEAGLAAFIWVKAAEAGAGHSCLAIPTFANFIENPHYGEDAIARQVMLQQHPELANPKTAKKAFEQHQVERAMSDWVNQPCEPAAAPSGPQPMSEAEEQRRHQQRIANLDLSAIPAPPSPWSKP